MNGKLVQGITIGQLAEYAGVTIKGIRHYHRRGLLEEPPRDASGYRRYGAQHAIALVKIRTLVGVEALCVVAALYGRAGGPCYRRLTAALAQPVGE
jgi:hypothetical protein